MDNRTPPEGPDETAPAAPRSGGGGPDPGAAIGPYRLVRRIGEGGMGEVWEADQQTPVRRRVALKLIKPSGMGTRGIVARFHSERQALALMQHPGIAQIFNAGTAPDGRPYFAMELCDGVPVTRHCDRQRLDVPARLRLFLRICDAVQHAHRKGIIHRDLKPSNVLMTAQGGEAVPKVIDFGLAKATEVKPDEPTETQMGSWVGTPAYASPEQLLFVPGGVDTRSDVYSLTMLLYELLVGALPFDLAAAGAETAFDLRKKLFEDELAPPGVRFAALENRAAVAEARGSDPAGLLRALRGDLSWIVMKGLKRDPSRRYRSVDELAADLGRYLAHEPLTVGPPGAAYRAGKFVRRHRAGIAAVLALFAVTAGFAVTMAVSARRIAGERDRATAEAAKAEAVLAFLEETFGDADPWKSHHDMSVRETLGHAAARIEASFPGQPLVAAAVRRAIGRTLRNLGRYDDARPLLEAVLAVRTGALGPEDVEVAASHFDLARLDQDLGKLAQAEEHSRAGLAIQRARLGPRSAAAAAGLNDLAVILFRRGKFEDAARAAEESLHIREEVFGPRSLRVAETLIALAAIAGDGLGDLERSEKLILRCLEIRRAASAPAPAIADALNQLATLRHKQGQLASAEELYREALQVARAALGADHPTTAVLMENLGGVLKRQERHDEALALLAQVLAVRRKKLGADSPLVARTMLNIATTQTSAGQLDAAEAGFRAALPLLRTQLGEDHPDVAATLGNLASLRARQGHDDEAESLHRQALAIRVLKLRPNHASLARNRLMLARLLVKRGELEESETLLLAALGGLESAAGNDARQTGEVVDELARLYDAWGKPAQAARVRAGAASPPHPR